MTNALRERVPRNRHVGVRIVHSEMNGVLRLEVSDAGPGRPEVRAPTERETSGRGLMLVEALADQWGVNGREGGIGKIVWAQLKASGLPLAAVREVAAITVRAGQHVRAWGAWHTVRNVRSEQLPSGDLALVLTLDDGPVVRVRACEPLTVLGGQTAGCAGRPGKRGR